MENKLRAADAVFDAKQYRDEMRALGLSVYDVAEAADMRPSNVNACLAGKTYLGPGRVARLERALRELALEVARRRAEGAEAPARRKQPIRIHPL